MKKSFLLLHLSVLLAGLTGIFGKLISLNEVVLVWFRVCLSFLLLWAGLKTTGRLLQYTGRERLRLACSGLLPALHWIFFYGSIKYANVSVGVVCYCLTAFFTAILGPMLGRKKLSFFELLLSLVTVAGVGLIFHFDTSFRLGILLGIVSSLFASFYFLTNEVLVKQYDTGMLNYFQMLGATVGIGIFLPFYLNLFPGARFIPTAADAGYLLVLALVCTVGMNALIAEALKKLSAFTVNLCMNLEPVYSIILAILFLNESQVLHTSFYAGLSLIILSVALQMLSPVVLRYKRSQRV
ncbi:DMT family transporter [Paraflavisolibacter sp. H34]|uniref:DMT family transporter n=1 Tax=Huijunlia imazamoxiresistens TaxID=3127457 RepID=UPI0030195D5A